MGARSSDQEGSYAMNPVPRHLAPREYPSPRPKAGERDTERAARRRRAPSSPGRERWILGAAAVLVAAGCVGAQGARGGGGAGGGGGDVLRARLPRGEPGRRVPPDAVLLLGPGMDDRLESR